MNGQLSTGLPREWIERIFARLTAIYGANKMSGMWGDVPQEQVVTAWCLGLAGISGGALRMALERMPLEHPHWPPTLGELATLARQHTERIHQRLPALPAPRTSFDPRVREAIAAVELGNRKDPKKWARDILREASEGTYRHPYGISCAREALGIAATREPGEEG